MSIDATTSIICECGRFSAAAAACPSNTHQYNTARSVIRYEGVVLSNNYICMNDECIFVMYINTQ